MKKDIENIEDIKLLVNSFYDKVNQDQVLGPIFKDIAKIDWQKHLPIMYQFWSSVLLGEMGYKGNPMEAHFRLNEKQALKGTDFSRWKSLFEETIDELFAGETASFAKQRAIAIADLMLYKIQNFRQSAGTNIGRVRR